MTQALVPQATSDTQLIALWLHGYSPRTQEGYSHDISQFTHFVERPLQQVTLAHLQAFADSLLQLAPATQMRRLAAVKSLLAFGHRLGYLPFDVGRALRLPGRKHTLAERILSEAEVHQMLVLEPERRNRTLLKLLYAGGLRVSEVCALKWRDLQPRGEAGQVTVFGKGEKTRAVLLPASVWRELMVLRKSAFGEDPVFPSRKGGGHLQRARVWKIARAAAKRAGIDGDVSPHWLRHAHASHALDRGCPISLVQATLGHSSVATTGRYLHARPSDSSARYLAV